MEIYKIENLSNNSELHIIHLKEYAEEFKKIINDYVVLICEGESDSTLSSVKKRLRMFLESKDIRTRRGATAEFFIHLYLNNNGYKQECLFFNLEETSIKKGFDGFYSKGEDFYVVESKSGGAETKTISHLKKIKEAYSDLGKYFSGTSNKGKNNPWNNAYNHASHIDVGTKKSLRKKIAELREMYSNDQYMKIDDFNIIPCSTIYLQENWDNKWSDELLEKIDDFKEFKGNIINFLVVTNQSLGFFETYLESEDE
jgi:hypothetical protein